MEIWICERDGANARQLTNLAGPSAGAPNWSPDGSQIVFDARLPGSAIFVIPAAGGAEARVVDSLGYWQNFSLVAAGIYYVPAADGPRIPIRFFDLASGVSRLEATVESLSSQGISAASDRRSLVFSRRETADRDLMLMEIGR